MSDIRELDDILKEIINLSQMQKQISDLSSKKTYQFEHFLESGYHTRCVRYHEECSYSMWETPLDNLVSAWLAEEEEKISADLHKLKNLYLQNIRDKIQQNIEPYTSVAKKHYYKDEDEE